MCNSWVSLLRKRFATQWLHQSIQRRNVKNRRRMRLCVGVMRAVWACVLEVGVVTWIVYGSDLPLDISLSKDGYRTRNESLVVSLNQGDFVDGSSNIHGPQNGSREVRDILSLRDSSQERVAFQQRQNSKLEGRLSQLKFINSNMANGVRWARDTRDLSARPVDCADLMVMGAERSGVYDIYPFTCNCRNKVQVWCDMETDGGGWTVFLSRQAENPREDFNRSWAQYKKGFGDRSEEYWLGLEALHAITSSRKYNLRLDLLLSNNIPVYNIWQNFRIGSEDTGNCLTYANGRSFSTYDVDEDVYSGNCAALRGGGWWYYDCQQFNPTNSGGDNAGETGFNISCLNRDILSLDGLQLKVRPTVCSDKVKSVYLNTYQAGNCGQFSVGP
nr:techylectin-5A-like isoform X2 [Cherax quadricarinatus]